MKTKLITTLLALSFIAFAQNPNAYLFNKRWQNIDQANTSAYDFLVSTVSPNGNLVYISNSVNGSGNADIELVCISTFGTVTWQTDCSSNLSKDDYGTIVKVDASNNIYVGAAKNNGADTDYYIAKYSSTGTLIWQYTYGGTGNDDDVPSDLIFDSSGNVYITGTCVNAGTLNDVTTIMLNSSGTMQWIANYDYSGYMDGGMKISFDSGGNLIVCSGTSDSAINSEFTVLKYDVSGTLLGSIRNVTSGNGFDYPTSMDINTNDDIFITGTCDNNGNKSIKTVSFSSGLTLNWAVITDKYGNLDEGYDIKTNSTSNVLITGYSTRSNNSVELNVINYNASTGAVIWEYTGEPETTNSIVKGHKLLINQNGDILVAGETGTSTLFNTLLLGLDTSGVSIFQNTYPFQNTTSYANNINDDNSSIYLSGYSQIATSKHIVNLKIDSRLKSTGFVTDTVNSSPLYMNNQLIFRFNPSQLNMTTINNTDVVYGKISDFIDTTLLVELKTYTKLRFEDVDVVKIFPDLTSNDTISISRLNDTVRIPAFWASLILEFPSNTNLQGVIDTVRKYSSDKVYVSEYNWVGTLQSNDPQYSISASLHPTNTYPLSHIDVTNAWNVETGKSHVKIGILDSGVKWDHEDFGNGTFAGSVVKGGYDYISGQPISANSVDGPGHGTKISGIIGAIRNNNKGIAGIAGGDDNISQAGVSLYGQRIANASSQITVSDASAAMVDGATSVSANNAKYLGLHIMNNSWGFFHDGSNQQVNSIDPNMTTMKDATRFVFKNKVIDVFARGNNYGNTQANGGNSPIYPTTDCRDEWLISVGASGASTSSVQVPCLTSYSDWGSGMDLLAPGDGIIIPTLSHTSINGYNTTGGYNGTSFSAPHVAGVAGLMCSYYNSPYTNANNLAPEDVEQLMEQYAYHYSPAPNCTNTANGLLNAANIFSVITSPNYAVEHFSASYPASAASLIGTQTLVFDYDAPLIGLTAGTYQVATYQISALSGFYTSLPYLIGSWPRNSSSTPAGAVVSGKVVPEPDITLSGATTTGATVSGYIYHFTYNNTLNQSVNVWYPCNLSGTVNFAWTMHTTNVPPGGTVGIMDNNLTANGISLFPNPSSSEFNINVKQNENAIELLTVYDMQGKIICRVKPSEISSGSYKLNCANWSNGLYLINLSLEDGSSTNFKVIKND